MFQINWKDQLKRAFENRKNIKEEFE